MPFKEGDWECPNCGDHNFARNTSCRKCGTPKDGAPRASAFHSRGEPPRERGLGPPPRVTFKEGDWECSNCGDHNFARNTSCRKCGTPREGESRASAFHSRGEPARREPPRERGLGPPPRMTFKEGDWECSNCGDHNFARNTSCRKCGTPRDDEGALPPPSYSRAESPRGRGPPPRQDFKEGDWECAECGDHQFARNTTCRKCGAPRPREDYRPAPVSRGPPLSAREPPPSRGAQDFKPGDWNCAECGDHNFAKNESCRRCGAPKPFEDAVVEEYRPPPRSYVREERRPEPVMERERNFKEGDWECTACGDHQFARNSSCRKCGAPRPMVSSNNQISKAGDWICPNPDCRDLQFERNDACRRCGTPKPRNAGIRGGSPYERPASGRAAFAPPDRGAYAPPDRGNGQSFKAGDWECPNCGHHVFARNDSCGKCGTAKPEPGLGGGRYQPARQTFTAPEPRGNFKPGDWTCTSCGDHNFARNDNCRKCGAPKPHVSNNNQAMKAGDWICPNPECGDMQFARNDACRKCGTAKPDRDRSRSPPPRM
eukprot:TRINITY_DN8159_c0_g1_i1.p1 TRINITY_DN8159_c0_g1~~TRINITY_DN8159_c0_g1_i1.p1  ORF type:complete len:543 (+),score=50.03 TRINITY_DN8159_c0_g1_i1:80-1708(+)